MNFTLLVFLVRANLDKHMVYKASKASPFYILRCRQAVHSVTGCTFRNRLCILQQALSARTHSRLPIPRYVCSVGIWSTRVFCCNVHDRRLYCYSCDLDLATQMRVRQRSDQYCAYVSTLVLWVRLGSRNDVRLRIGGLFDITSAVNSDSLTRL